jgi:hypothetical protein
VTLTAAVDVPPGTGTVVGLEWDFEGTGDFAEVSALPDTEREHVELSVIHRFARAGTYFPAVRASAQRGGDAETPFARIQNLGRVRVVVK